MGEGARGGERGQPRRPEVLTRDVAVKVVHPNLAESVATDMELLQMVGDALNRRYPYYSMGDALEAFQVVMASQMDLEIEARNLEILRENFAGDPTVTFPEPIREFTCSSVLTESFIEGVPILRAVGTPEAARLAKNGTQAVLSMIFNHNFIHGDLHPG